jgi:S1-C subfamily serine protease
MRMHRRQAALALLGAALLGLAEPARADMMAAIERVKPSVVSVGSYKETNNPRFGLAGTGFVVGDGHYAITNAHVIDRLPDENARGSLVVQIRAQGRQWEMRKASLVETDTPHDLALLRFEGAAVPALALRDSDGVREGQAIAFMGFPIGGALGFTSVTHRGMVSAITPVALPSPSARQLTAAAIHRLREGPFEVFQLDATAYPGNSGGPLFDPDSGEVLGVVNMGVIKGTKESALTNPSGISFAVPSKFVAQLLQRQGKQ